MKVHVWIPDYESAMGGIQMFSQFFIRAVGDCLPDATITVFSKNDSVPSALPCRRGRSEFRCVGWWPQQLRTFAFSSQIFANVLRQRPDLILSTHVNFTPVASVLKRLCGIPYAAVAHGMDVWGIGRGRIGHALHRADRVFAVSRFTRARMLEDFKLDPDRVGLLPNTADTDRCVPMPKPHYLLKRFGLMANQPVILTVARLATVERYKGYDQVLRALPAIRCAVPTVRYILGGRGPDRRRVEALVRELKVEDSVTLAGYIPDHELCDFYNLCDVFAMPSKGEGFGIVFLEALACGKPVLAGNKDGSVDALLNGELGVLVDPDNVSEIAEALTAMLLRQHPLAILQQPDKLRARVIEAYGYEKFVQCVAGHLAQLPGTIPFNHE